VVPIENSTEGVVNHTLDMFMESNLVICAEREEPISHYLLSSSGQLSKIKKIFSHPQALAQCRKWIESRLAKVEIQESASTADAACQASLDGSAAAIASCLAAKLYHLKVVAPRIEDFQENFTRFLIIGKHSPGPSTKDKTSILFSITDRIGALNDILLVFKRFRINLTKIESRPTKKKAWEYIFFVDFLGHSTEPAVQSALSELKKYCLYMKILGSYPRTE
jgi:chorismate mutase/prephenate dehydratase